MIDANPTGRFLCVREMLGQSGQALRFEACEQGERREHAVANAVFNATGVRVRDLPITLDKLLPGLDRLC